MKKILPSLLIGLLCIDLKSSDHEKVKDFFHHYNLELARRKKYGTQIGDINGIRPHIQLLVEIHQADARDNPQALLKEGRMHIFYRHLVHHFGQKEIIDFIDIIERHAPETVVVVEEHFEQAANNYLNSRRAPQVTPQGKSFIGYLTMLRDQNE